MKPAPFEYLAPNSLEAALEAMAEHGDEAKLLAGGQSLVPAMNFRIYQPSMLVDINRLSELDFIHQTDEGELRIGPMTRHRSLETDPLVAKLAPLLQETVPYIAHLQIRNRGTFGGSLAHADPAAELPVTSLALGARFKVQSVDDERWIPVEKFFLGIFYTDLAPDEILVEVSIPPMPPRTGWSFMEISRRTGDYAMMGVAALVTLNESGVCEQARLVYLNAGDGPVNAKEAALLLLGNSYSQSLIEASASTAADREIDPMGNVHASVAYQRHLARVLTQRALNQAFDCANRQIC